MTDRAAPFSEITDADLAAARALYAPTLKPCPFCAGWLLHRPHDARGHIDPRLFCDQPTPGATWQVWRVKCWSCGASVTGPSARAVTDIWNRRTP